MGGGIQLVQIDDLPAQPWRNGGGVTREIARLADEVGLIWRLSLADVERNGPFSIFAGLRRILTVVDGAGLRLRHASGVIAARPGVPVGFDGELAIEGELVDGPVRDFNVMYDPCRVDLVVKRLEAGRHAYSSARPLGLLPLAGPSIVAGAGEAPAGSFLLFENGVRALDVVVPEGGAALLVRME